MIPDINKMCEQIFGNQILREFIIVYKNCKFS